LLTLRVLLASGAAQVLAGALEAGRYTLARCDEHLAFGVAAMKIENLQAQSASALPISKEEANGRRQGAARLSLASNLSLFVLKLGVGLASGSVSVLSEAAHSASDLVASALTLFSVRLVDMPPDENHPYGHGKIEGISTLAQGLLLAGVATYIVYESVHRLLSHAEPPQVEWGMAIMAASALANVFVVRVVRRAARETDSLALLAVSKDHLADIYAASGVLLGLVLVRLTGKGFFDSVMAIAVAALIFHSAWELGRSAVHLLMDTPLSAEEVESIRKILDESPGVLGYHKLRTRNSGTVQHVDAHILLEDSLPLVEAHDLTEAVEDLIRDALPRAEVTLHCEPFHAEQEHQEQAHGAERVEPRQLG
jgi:cation diffusion facilitator family transporter